MRRESMGDQKEHKLRPVLCQSVGGQNQSWKMSHREDGEGGKNGMQSWFVPVCISKAKIWTNMRGNHQWAIINTQAVTSAPLPQSKNVVLRALWSLAGWRGGPVRCKTWTPQYFFVITVPYGLEKTANQRKINKMTHFFLNSTGPFPPAAGLHGHHTYY